MIMSMAKANTQESTISPYSKMGLSESTQKILSLFLFLLSLEFSISECPFVVFVNMCLHQYPYVSLLVSL